jgi:hypothetical protein
MGEVEEKRISHLGESGSGLVMWKVEGNSRLGAGGLDFIDQRGLLADW